MPPESFLSIAGISKRFGGVHAVKELGLELGQGDLLTLIGPNGCGKTTLFNLITGQVPPDSGMIRLMGEDITGRKPHQIATCGVGRKFQVPSVYPDLTVDENLRLARISARAAGRGSPAGDAFEAIIPEMRLDSMLDAPAAQLSHGQKQWLEIAMVFAGNPRLILLDEPTAGMTRPETERTVRMLKEAQNLRAASIIVIEHDMRFVEQIGGRVAVMIRGRIVADGSYADVRANPKVVEAYLGGGGA